MRLSPKTCDVTLKLCVQLFKSCLPGVHCTHDQNVKITFKGPHCKFYITKNTQRETVKQFVVS